MRRQSAPLAARIPIVAACLLQLAIAGPLVGQLRPTMPELFQATGPSSA